MHPTGMHSCNVVYIILSGIMLHAKLQQHSTGKALIFDSYANDVMASVNEYQVSGTLAKK